mgnify:CR=1 FL=1
MYNQFIEERKNMYLGKVSEQVLWHECEMNDGILVETPATLPDMENQSLERNPSNLVQLSPPSQHVPKPSSPIRKAKFQTFTYYHSPKSAQSPSKTDNKSSLKLPPIQTDDHVSWQQSPEKADKPPSRISIASLIN